MQNRISILPEVARSHDSLRMNGTEGDSICSLR